MKCRVCSFNEGIIDGICGNCISKEIDLLQSEKHAYLIKVSQIESRIQILAAKLATPHDISKRTLHWCVCGKCHPSFQVIHNHIKNGQCEDCERKGSFCNHNIEHRLMTAEDRARIVRESLEREEKTIKRVSEREILKEEGW